MDKYQYNKQRKVNEILSFVKITSLLFAGIALFKYFFKDDFTKKIDAGNIFYIVCIPFVVLTSIYLMWALVTFKNKLLSKTFYIFESFVFVLIFFGVIIISGAYASEYKFLFLFIIITSTIQSGIKVGIFMSIVSTLLLLIMDVVYLPNETINVYFEDDLIMGAVFFLTSWPLGYYVKVEKDHIKNLQELANIDGLTGLYNHRVFHDRLNEEINLCEEKNSTLSMIFMDVDNFKNYNDLYGHIKGDELLKKISVILTGLLSEKFIIARYGGDEFGILLPDTNEEEAILNAELIRKKIIEESFVDDRSESVKPTVSLGISIYPHKAKSSMALVKSADDALYRAKYFNKNRVEVYSSIMDDLKNDIEEEHIDLVTSIKTLISVINAKDRYTYGHVERVVIYCRLIAKKLNLEELDKKHLIYGAYMHDIGKINILKEILTKDTQLNLQEWNIMKKHPENGVEIIKSVNSLKDVTPLILFHHEKYDGTGYPQNLKGEEIPFLARVLSIADSFDAMTSNRPYAKRKTFEEAILELKKHSGKQFDPDITSKFIEVIIENKEKYFSDNI